MLKTLVRMTEVGLKILRIRRIHSSVVLVGLTVAGMKHCDQKQIGEERVYFILQLGVYHPGKSGKEPGARN